MTEKELREKMKCRPWLCQIDRILGKSATPEQKMELFVLLQKVVGQAVKRTVGDLTAGIPSPPEFHHPVPGAFSADDLRHLGG